MPAMEVDCLNQKAVLWASNGFDNYGNPKVDAAVEIKVRWEKGRKENLDPLTANVGIDSTVVVDRVIPLRSIMWLGALADLPSPTVDLRQVIDSGEIPDVKNRYARRVVMLTNWSDTLPDSA